MTRTMIVVNASGALRDQQVLDALPPLQRQIDEHFLPRWPGAQRVELAFADINDVSYLPRGAWAIFLNRHSLEEGALGWHDDDPKVKHHVYSRVFVGDCLRFGLNWEVTLGHEALEMILDPTINRTFDLGDGRAAALEACDAVESDALAYSIDGHRVTNFVLPAYFSRDAPGPYDYRGVLTGRCPALAPGGYLSLRGKDGGWTQVLADEADGLAGSRYLLGGFRRRARAAGGRS